VEIPLVVRGVKNTTFFLQPPWTETGGPDRELGSPLLSVRQSGRSQLCYFLILLCSRNELMPKVSERERVQALEAKLKSVALTRADDRALFGLPLGRSYE
jgi:hypothetical protein